jgi:hypothetical protein
VSGTPESLPSALAARDGSRVPTLPRRPGARPDRHGHRAPRLGDVEKRYGDERPHSNTSRCSLLIPICCGGPWPIGGVLWTG